jgi:hypothetical protein
MSIRINHPPQVMTGVEPSIPMPVHHVVEQGLQQRGAHPLVRRDV